MPQNIILSGSPVAIANAATLSTGFDLQQRPLSWVQLPTDWPAGTPLMIQAAVTDDMPVAGSAEWRDVVDRTGAAITLSGAPGQIISVDPGLVMGLRFLRFRVASALSGARSLTWGGWYIGG
ncbi:hypothetical protein VQH23_21135 [Pararoseomonas sp. SCSIO 73927]|uniref:hypothetical protein n=1 Tax=Pararoseomonas sp. SCSIO 73927 TaxID=3114537 RepID=UPI0030CFA16A